MTEAQTGVFVLLLISVVAAFFAFALIRNFFLACAASAVAAAVLFQIAAYLHVGYLDPFFPIAIVVTVIVALGVAAVVGLAIRRSQ